MQDWQFFLQKESDSSGDDRLTASFWKASNDSTIALEEGVYKIVARSSHPNLDVTIKITHQIIEAGKTLRRSKKRCSRSNSTGLVVILPFTEFKAGWWEIQCSGELIAEEGKQAWQKNLEIQVYSKPDSIEPNSDRVNLQLEEQTSKTECGDREKLLAQSEAIALSCDLLEHSLSSFASSSSEIELFEPKKITKESESIQTLPLSGQILPPKMSANTVDTDSDRQENSENRHIAKDIQLPKVNLTELEKNLPLEIKSHIAENLDRVTSPNPAVDDRFEALNLQQRFWSRINSLASDSQSDSQKSDRNC
jgi:hypothetical protein